MIWIPIRTKQLCPNLKRHIAAKNLGALNTTYLTFIEYERTKMQKLPF